MLHNSTRTEPLTGEAVHSTSQPSPDCTFTVQSAQSITGFTFLNQSIPSMILCYNSGNTWKFQLTFPARSDPLLGTKNKSKLATYSLLCSLPSASDTTIGWPTLMVAPSYSATYCAMKLCVAPLSTNAVTIFPPDVHIYNSRSVGQLYVPS